MIHDNSTLAYEEGKADGSFSTRRENIYWAMRRREVPMTDREVADALRLKERNSTSPRINEMLADGLLREVDSVTCPETGHQVRRCVVVAEFFPKPAGDAAAKYSKANKELAMVRRMRPTEPGYYWYGEGQPAAPKVVHVVDIYGRLCVPALRFEVWELQGYWSAKLKPAAYGLTSEEKHE